MAAAPSRRRFLELAATGVATGIAATLTACSDTLRANFGPLMPPGPATAAGAPRQVGPLSALNETPTSFPVKTLNGGDAVYAYLSGDTPVVLSNVCTHRGCGVAWIAAQNNFQCPCHDGTFGIDGQVLGGPPPAALTRYTTETKDGVLFIKG